MSVLAVLSCILYFNEGNLRIGHTGKLCISLTGLLGHGFQSKVQIHKFLFSLAVVLHVDLKNQDQLVIPIYLI